MTAQMQTAKSSLSALVDAHRSGAFSPEATIADCYARIRAHADPAVFISLRDEEDALAEARALLAGRKRDGALLGVPVVVKDNIDVKGLAGTTSWPVDNVKKKADDHFLVFVSFIGKIGEHSVPPEVYVVPSKQLAPLVYHSPNGKRHVLQLSRMRKDGTQFRDAWDLLK